MWAYVLRRVLYAVPVYLGIVLLLMVALRLPGDPAVAFLGKNADAEQLETIRRNLGLDRPFIVQYLSFLGQVVTLDFSGSESWDQPGRTVGELFASAIGPSLALTVPALVLTAVTSIAVGLISAYFRGRLLDRTLMVLIVLGMSISVLVFIVLGQYFGAYWLKGALGREIFATGGYEPLFFGGPERPADPANWVRYCMLPVMISVVVAVGYDTRFYRAVMVEECTRDYITTALAKGADKPRVMLVHMLKNAMIPVITRVMMTLPFLVTGSILLERYFRIPGMGRLLLEAIAHKDFPVIQAFTALFALLFIATNILTDVLYALVDPRVKLA